MTEILGALRSMESHEQERTKDYGDVAKVLDSNPLMAAIVNHVVNSVYAKVIEEIDRRTVPPQKDLLTVEEVAEIMQKSVKAVHRLKERGVLEAFPRLVNGRLVFSLDAVKSALSVRSK